MRVLAASVMHFSRCMDRAHYQKLGQEGRSLVLINSIIKQGEGTYHRTYVLVQCSSQLLARHESPCLREGFTAARRLGSVWEKGGHSAHGSNWSSQNGGRKGWVTLQIRRAGGMQPRWVGDIADTVGGWHCTNGFWGRIYALDKLWQTKEQSLWGRASLSGAVIETRCLEKHRFRIITIFCNRYNDNRKVDIGPIVKHCWHMIGTE